MEQVVTAIIGLIFGSIGGSLVSFYFYKRQARWDALRAAGINALKVSDSVLSNMTWTDKSTGKSIAVIAQPAKVEDARQALNDLALTCKNPEVIEKFMATIGVNTSPSGDSIVDLRNAIRAELGFGKPLETDRESAFIASVPGDKQS